MVLYLFRVKNLEEEIEKLTGQLNEKKEQITTWEKSIETMKSKNNVSIWQFEEEIYRFHGQFKSMNVWLK